MLVIGKLPRSALNNDNDLGSLIGGYNFVAKRNP